MGQKPAMVHKRVLSIQEAMMLSERLGVELKHDELGPHLTLPVDPWEIKDFEQIMLRWGNRKEGEVDLVGDLLAEVYRVEVV